MLDYFGKNWADLLQIDQQNVNGSMNSSLKQYDLHHR